MSQQRLELLHSAGSRPLLLPSSYCVSLSCLCTAHWNHALESRVLAAVPAWCAGDGGAHKHYGPTYIGLQPPPVALCLNLFNIDYRQPQNKWAQNPTACQRLYDETMAIINSKAPNKISAVEAIAKQMT